MSRPIAYNASGPLSGSIRGGNVNYTVDSGNRDYTTFASKKWVPSADGVAPIVFVTDTYTQGFELNPSLAVPLFYSCAGTGSAAIIYTANRIPGSPGNYSDANVALNDLITARGYFILESNDPFEGVDADSLVFDIDASKMSSYPQAGTNVYDLSGYGGNGTLNNGVVWTASSGSFFFDGTDDEIYANSYAAIDMSGTQQYTAMATVYPLLGGTTWHGIFSKGNNQQYALTINSPSAFLHYESNQSAYPALNSAGGSVDVNRWQHFVARYDGNEKTIWKNGEIIATQATPGLSSTSNTEELRIGEGNNGENFRGEITSVQVYRRSLSTAEVKQNYFGAPIVTDGLVFAVDANNIVSYPKSGTSWFNLTGSNVGTLINGPTFNQENGGSIKFDGTDDYVNVPTATNLDLTSQGTVSTWINPATVTQGLFAGLVARNTGGSVNQQSYGLSWRQVSGALLAEICDGAGTYNQIFATLPTVANVWYNIVFTWNGSQLVLYNNGVIIGTTTQTINNQVLNTDLTIGGYTYKGGGGSGEPFNGKIANTKLYNRGLTAAEVLQNYQAEQYRFETPAGPVTNGLVLYWDAGNLDSYPGTGTTIYDLSGNGNNGTLVNGVTYNQTNGGVLITDGIDDYIYCNTPNLSSTNFTEMGAARYISFVRPGGLYPGGRMINANSNNWLMGHWGNTVDNYFAEGTITGINGSISDLNWRIYAGNGDISGDVYSFYMNNSLYASNGGGSAGPNGVMIGKYPLSNLENANGAFSFLLIYNRILTTAEMTQNYNYFKGRFGL
jgi:hypothetical protein